MNQICIKMEDVSYRRGDLRILKNINWEVKSGERWVILGGNGSGKTTLARVATGYIGSSSGKIYLLEGWIHHIILPEIRKQIGFVSSAIADHLLRWWTFTPGLEVVLSGTHAMIGACKDSDPERKVAAHGLLAEMGFGHLAQAHFGLMSSGERQVCLIARAQMSGSRITIYDEPCAGLDIAAREKTLAALHAACGQNPKQPQILITHHPEEITPGFTHALLLKNGSIIAQGPIGVTLSEETLSEVYSIPISMRRENSRYWIQPGR